MTNPFKKILGSFSKKEKSVLGVDIGASSVKIVQLRKRHGVAVLETYGELALGPYAGLEIGQATKLTVAKYAEAIKDLIKEANITTLDAGMSIPFTSSLISLIEMPALDRKQLARMIPIEARKYIPVPISEVTLDWFIVPDEVIHPVSDINADINADTSTEEKKKVNVLLVAIHNETLGRYRDIIKLAGLDVNFFEIEIFSTIRAVLEQSLTPVMIIDMSAGATKLYIVEYGIVKMSHIINVGAQDITRAVSRSLDASLTKAEEVKRKRGLSDDNDDSLIIGSKLDSGLSKNVKSEKSAMMLILDRIFLETNRVLLQYEKKYNKNVGQVVLTGGGAVLKGLGALAEKHLSTKVSLGDPFSKIETPAFLEDILREVGPGFAVAVGLALRKLQEGE